jgi:thioredoxin reductase (NADPH)
VRGGTLASSMSSYLSSRLEADPAITIEYGTHAVELHGGDNLEAVTIRNGDGDRTVACTGKLSAVGRP